MDANPDRATRNARPVALVTGGAVRIGRAISLAFAAAGFDVAVHCRRSRDEAEALCQDIAALHPGTTARAVAADLAAPAGCDAAFDAALGHFGRVDVLVNNAAGFARGPLRDAAPEDFETLWRTDALAPALLAKRFARAFGERGKNGAPFFPPMDGHAAIVNLLDQRLARPRGGCIPYVMAKAALEAFTRAAAVELAPGITVNAVAPGAVLPPPPAAGVREPAGPSPLGLRPTPEAVAAAAVALATNPYVTGQVLYVDAGQHLL